LESGEDAERATAHLRGNRTLEEYQRGGWVGTVDQIAERIQAVVDTGINYVICYIPRVAYDQTTMRRFATEVIPRFA
jgi:alkanesulfonate monooxygenase SsuD/methylene tetrahydromethanopterin reductase-like flavin-dependent oxidoreductase (luciferase family)